MIDIERVNKRKLYWIFQILGWSLYNLIFTAIALYFVGWFWELPATYLLQTVSGFILTHLYRQFILKQNSWTEYGILRLVVFVLLSSALIGFLWALIIIPISKVFFPLVIPGLPEFHWFVEVVLSSVSLSITFLGWQLIYFVFQHLSVQVVLCWDSFYRFFFWHRCKKFRMRCLWLPIKV